MRIVLQRVRSASVTVDGAIVGEIGQGLLLLVGIGQEDTEAISQSLAEKIANLRIFEDDSGKMNHSALESAAEILVVSQFTLYADTKHGRRPSFIAAAKPDIASPLVDHFATALRCIGLTVAQGTFGAHMDVALLNDGPVTLIIEN